MPPERPVPVLMWHHVGAPPTDELRPYAVSPELFAAQLDALADAGFEAVTLEGLRAGLVPPRPVVLTFDDGYRSFVDAALPALHERRWPAVLFVVAGSIAGVNEWDRGAEALELLDHDELRELAAAGHELGAHGWRHRRMPAVPVGRLTRELLAARAVLETLTERPVRTLSYPHGECDPAVLGAVGAAGFAHAFLDTRGAEDGWPPALALTRVEAAPDLAPEALTAQATAWEAGLPAPWTGESAHPLQALAAETLRPGRGLPPASGWAAVHAVSAELVEVLQTLEAPREQGALIHAAATADPEGRPLAAALAPVAPALDARLAACPPVPVWGAPTPDDAAAVPVDHLAVGHPASDPIRHLWGQPLSRQPEEVASYLRAAGRRHGPLAVRRVLALLPVAETAMLAQEALERRSPRRWDAVEESFSRVDVDGGPAPRPAGGLDRRRLVTAVGALMRQDVVERHGTSWAGALWALGQPLLTFAVLALVFGSVVRIDVEDYPEFLLAGLVPWLYVQRVVSQAPTTLRGRGDLVRFAPFPRLALALVPPASGLVELGLQAVVAAAVLQGLGSSPVWQLALLVPLAAVLVALAAGAAVLAAGLAALWRDVGNLVPLLLGLLFYAVPVVYPASLVPDGWRTAYRLDPLATTIEAWRVALLGGTWPPAWALVWTALAAPALLAAAVLWFRRAEDGLVARA